MKFIKVLSFAIVLILAAQSNIFAEVTSTALQGTQFGPVTITASSMLAPQAGNSYAPKNIVDGNSRTAWVEGAGGDGIGQWIKITFGTPMKIGSAYVSNGYGKNASVFKKNNRIRTALITTQGGSFEVTLPDTLVETKIKFPKPVTTKWVKLTIKSVYHGTKWKDTALNEFLPDMEEYNYQ